MLVLAILCLVTPAYAVCPLCTLAVGAGIGFTQWLGIDDTITGIWIGGLIVSMIIWTIFGLNKKKLFFPGRKLLVTFISYLSILGPCYYTNIIGHPLNTLWGCDRLILGIIIGSTTFVMGHLTYETMKHHHHGRAYFPLQKVVMPVIPLVICSILFYFIT